MKRTIARKLLPAAAALIAAVFAMGMMTGCGDSGNASTDSGSADGSDNGTPSLPAYYEVEDSVDSAAGEGIGTLTAYLSDGTEAWSVQTDSYPMTELSKTADIGERENGYYIEAGGTVYCFDKNSGDLLWRCDDFQGAASGWDFGADGTLYICGYYGPMLCVIAPNGKVLHRYDEPLFRSSAYDPADYYWPTDLKAYDGYVTIHFDSIGDTLYIDPDTCHSEFEPDLF